MIEVSIIEVSIRRGSTVLYFEFQTQSPGGVLRISSEGDDQRLFLGLKFLIPGFFWVGKFGKYFFGG